jgi:arginyl-tRNA synthetase
MSSLRLVFEAAIKAAFPQCAGAGSEELAKLATAVITRCGNPAFGDFQCNNAMALSKALKGLAGYTGERVIGCVVAMCVCICRSERGESDYKQPAT